MACDRALAVLVQLVLLLTVTLAASSTLDAKNSVVMLDTNIAVVTAIAAPTPALTTWNANTEVASDADTLAVPRAPSDVVRSGLAVHGVVPDTNIAVVVAVPSPKLPSSTASGDDAVAREADATRDVPSVAPATSTLGSRQYALDVNTAVVQPATTTALQPDESHVASEAELALRPVHASEVGYEAVESVSSHHSEVPGNSGSNNSSSNSSRHVQFAIRSGKEKSRGVNLGGWLVAEHWMTKDSEIWWGVTRDDANLGEFTAMNKTKRALALERAEAHRNRFITERDIAAIARAGLNTVRVPVGYWIIGFDNHDTSNRKEWETYAPHGLNYLDRLVRDWAKTHNVAVLVSMHAAKGSQNGADHSSPADKGGSHWASYPENVASTLDAVRFLAQRYATDDAFLGIGLLNEPSGTTTTDVLYQYYANAYRLIRTEDKNDCVLTIAPLLVQQSPKYMTDVLPHATNVWVEWHRYFVWGFETTSEHELLHSAIPAFRADVEQWRAVSDKKVYIGEFSFATARGQFDTPSNASSSGNSTDSAARLQAFAQAQLAVLHEAVDGGYAFWSWRVHGDESPRDVFARWSLRNMLANGVVAEL